MIEIFPKDEEFEKQLFNVSTQSRDIKGQVTFRLKDEFHSWFDPFHYISFDQHSQIFQMYEQNQLRDKFLDQGLNDIVGDYNENYNFATELNGQLIKNLASSQILKIIIPLLQNWFKNKDLQPQKPETEEKSKFTDLLSMVMGAGDKSTIPQERKLSFAEKLKRKLSGNSSKQGDEDNSQP